MFVMLRWYKAKNLKHKKYLTFCTGKERHKPASKGILTDRWCAARCDASPMAMHLNSNLEIRRNLPNHPGLGGAPIEFGWVYSATQSALLFWCICIVLCFRAFSQQQHYVSLKNGFRRTGGILRPSPLRPHSAFSTLCSCWLNLPIMSLVSTGAVKCSVSMPSIQFMPRIVIQCLEMFFQC